MRRFTLSLFVGAIVLGGTTPVWSDAGADQLAGRIETRVRRAISAGVRRGKRQAWSGMSTSWNVVHRQRMSAPMSIPRCN